MENTGIKKLAEPSAKFHSTGMTGIPAGIGGALLRPPFIEEREDGVYRGREPFINEGGRELFVKEPVIEEGSRSSRRGGSNPSRQGYRSADAIHQRGREDTVN